MSENKGLLPIVTMEVKLELQAEVLASEDSIDKMLLDIAQNNGYIAQYIALEYGDTPCEGPKTCGVLVYKMLEKAGNIPMVGMLTTNELTAHINENYGCLRGYIIESIKHIGVENPLVIDFISGLAEGDEVIDKKKTINTGIIVYKLLEAQAEKNKQRQQTDLRLS